MDSRSRRTGNESFSFTSRRRPDCTYVLSRRVFPTTDLGRKKREKSRCTRADKWNNNIAISLLFMCNILQNINIENCNFFHHTLYNFNSTATIIAVITFFTYSSTCAYIFKQRWNCGSIFFQLATSFISRHKITLEKLYDSHHMRV